MKINKLYNMYNNKTTEILPETPFEALPEALTKHAIGSISELWAISFPLMLSSLSGTLMIFVDRIILAHYSTDAMNAAASAGMIFFAFMFFSISIAGIAEVFVGQHNGAKRYHKISEPVWQMIWFSAFMTLPAIGIGLWAAPFLIPSAVATYGIPYFKWLMIFGGAFPLSAALSAFFIGRGEVRVVTLSVAIGSLINFVLAVLLVFGIAGFIEPMGTKGAAIATGIAQLSISAILLFLFLQKKHRLRYQTLSYHLKWKPFFDCIHIGMPNALGHLISIAAWAFVLHLLASVSFEHITVFTISQSIWILFSFITDGSQKAICAVSSNLIGAKCQAHVKQVMRSGFHLQWIYAVFLIVPLILFPAVFIDNFLVVDLDSGISASLRAMTETSCHWMWLAFVFDSMTWVMAGVLTAGGDTRFIMWMNGIGSWVFAIVPIYVFVVILPGSPVLSTMLIAAYTLFMSGCFYWRYRVGRWENLLVHHA